MQYVKTLPDENDNFANNSCSPLASLWSIKLFLSPSIVSPIVSRLERALDARIPERDRLTHTFHRAFNRHCNSFSKRYDNWTVVSIVRSHKSYYSNAVITIIIYRYPTVASSLPLPLSLSPRFDSLAKAPLPFLRASSSSLLRLCLHHLLTLNSLVTVPRFRAHGFKKF